MAKMRNDANVERKLGGFLGRIYINGNILT